MNKFAKYIAVITAAFIMMFCSACSEAPPEIVRGAINGDTFINGFSMLTFTLPEGFSYMTDEYLVSLTKNSAGLSESADFADALKTNNSVYDMGVINNFTGDTLLVMYVNLDLSGMRGYSPQRYLKKTIEDLEKLNSPVISYTSDKTASKTKICGRDYCTMSCTASYTVNGSQNTMRHTYYSAKTGGYMICITVSMAGNSSENTVMNGFGH